MIIQKPLQKGALIDLIAPGSPVSSAQIQFACRQVENMGFKPRVLASAGKTFLFSAEDKQRFLYLKSALNNPADSAVWCIRGGYGCSRLMPFLLKMPRPAQAKLLIGYSDITVLQNFLNLKWGWQAFHFPVLEDLKNISKKNLKTVKALLTNSLKEQVFSNLHLLNTAKNKKIKSYVTGGNLTLIQSSVGTPWQFSFKNTILFLEDVGESAYRLDRALWQMKQAGVFAGVKALVLGSFIPVKAGLKTNRLLAKKPAQLSARPAQLAVQPPAKNPMEEKKIKKVFKLFSELVPFPVLWGVPCGHGVQKSALPFMTPAELKIDSKGKACLKIHNPYS